MTTDRKDASVHIKAGAISGFINVITLQPFDLLKTRLQQSNTHSQHIYTIARRVVRDEGTLGLWRGTLATMVRSVPGISAYFTTLEFSKRFLLSLSNSTSDSERRLTPQMNMLAGAVSRVIVGFGVMPVTVIKSRLESTLYTYKGISDAFTSIIRAEGVKGLFYGFGSTALRDAPYAGIYVLFYEHLKQLSGKETTSVYLGCAAVSGFGATVMTHPFDVIRTRIQLEPGVYVNTGRAVDLIFKREGMSGFMAGILPRLIRKTLSSAITWTIYEQLVKQLK